MHLVSLLILYTRMFWLSTLLLASWVIARNSSLSFRQMGFAESSREVLRIAKWNGRLSKGVLDVFVR